MEYKLSSINNQVMPWTDQDNKVHVWPVFFGQKCVQINNYYVEVHHM